MTRHRLMHTNKDQPLEPCPSPSFAPSPRTSVRPIFSSFSQCVTFSGFLHSPSIFSCFGDLHHSILSLFVYSLSVYLSLSLSYELGCLFTIYFAHIKREIYTDSSTVEWPHHGYECSFHHVMYFLSMHVDLFSFD